MVMLDRLIYVGQRLRLYPLRGVHDQQRALARRQTAADFIGEVDMARRVHEVQRIVEPVARAVVKPDCLRLDRDAAFLLNVHIVEHLLGHFARRKTTGGLDQPIGKRRFAMVDMGNDGKITDAVEGGHMLL